MNTKTHVGEYSNELVQNVKSRLKNIKRNREFLNGSSYGSFVDKLKSQRPAVDHVERSLFDSLANYFIEADKLAPGAGQLAIEIFTSDYQKFVDSNVCEPTEDEVYNLLSQEYDDTVLEVLKNAAHLMGSSVRLRYESSAKITDVTLEIKSGYCFDIQSTINVGHWRRQNCKVMCIDGMIESVSEITHLLNYFSTQKLPLVILARGYSNDVINTFSVNFKRGSLDILPLVSPVDFETANIMLDFSTVTSSDVISSDKGQLISSSNPDKLCSVDMIDFDSNKIIVINSKASKAVEILKTRIAEKLEKVDPYLVESTAKRLKSLDAAYGIVRYPKTVQFSNFDEKLSNAIRTFSHLLIHGYVNFSDKNYPSSTVKAAIQINDLIRSFLNSCRFCVLPILED